MTNPAGNERARLSLRHAFRSLESPEYRPWFISQLFSASGTMTQGVALSWLVLRLTGNSVDLGLMTSCTFLPMLLVGPWSGTLVDRMDRRRLLIVTQSLLALIAGLTAVLIATGAVRLWMIFVIAAVTGCVSAPDSTARQVYAIDLVGRDGVASAIGLYEVILNTSRVAGPAVGGALLATVGVAACCAVNAASYLQPLYVLIRHRPRYALAVPSGPAGLGALPGALLASAGPRRPTGRSVAVLALATAAAVFGTVTAPTLWLALIGLAATGCLSIWFIARANALVQLTADPSMRGRVMGLWTMALPGCEPVTGPFVGYVTQVDGPRDGLGLAGLALTLTATIGWRALADRRPPPQESPADDPVAGLLVTEASLAETA